MKRTYNPTPLWITRRLRGVSQQEAARAIEVNRVTIARAETGHPKVSESTLRKYAAWLGINFDTLQYRGPEKTSSEMSLST
jgi:transcriptional regulator with XRE-family HTH domain